jgi:hypothetical protein
MNVSLQNIDKVSALLTVKLEKADYQEKVDKALKNFRQNAQMPGFRKGMVPMSLVKKMYGKSATAEEVNKLLSETVYNYIQDNKVNILGEPLPNEDKQPVIDFDTMEEFEFLFDIALAPEFEAKVTAKDKVEYYNIDVTDEMVNAQVSQYKQRAGQYQKVDSFQGNDMLKGLLAELDAEGNTKEGGIQVEGAVMMPEYMKNADQKAIFNGAKVNDVLVFNPYNAWEGNAAELASLLKIEKDAVENTKGDFSFQVEEITRFVEGELNQEIFDKVFGKDVVKSYFGIRSTRFDNKHYILNNKPFYLRTVLDQGFYKKGIYTAETEEELVRDIYLSLDAGFNGERLHQKVFEKRFLYHCDKLGYLVFGETGNWGIDHSNMEQLATFLMEWQREIARDFNHPSIIGWCPLNETWDFENKHQNDDFIRALYYTTKSIDTTRPCVGTSGNYQVVSDIYDLHDYIQEKDKFEEIYLAPTYEEMAESYDKQHDWVSKYQKSIDYKGMALYLSEYGGIQWDVDGVGGWGYGNGPKTEEEFFERYEYLTKALINSPYVCGFCYTQLYDVEQEVNGLYTYERKPKFDMEKIKKITQAKRGE